MTPMRRLNSYLDALPYTVRVANKLYAVQAGRAKLVKTGPLFQDHKQWIITNGYWVKR